MPKKFKPQYTTIKPTNPAHSSPSSSSVRSNTEERTESVNDLLSRLRLAQASSQSTSQAQAQIQARTPIPNEAFDPRLYGTPPPQPSRRILTLDRRRRPPGPAPPASWLHRAQPARPTEISTDGIHYLSQDLSEFLALPEIERPSLIYYCLVALAKNWEFHREYDQFMFVDLPDFLKVSLIHFIVKNGSQLTIKDLENIFPAENNSTTDIVSLDLSQQIGWSMTLPQLRRFLLSGKTKSTEIVEESWDLAPLQPALSGRFSKLTRLSLARPSPEVSWADLLNFAKHMPTITHLSLAEWPRPLKQLGAADPAAINQAYGTPDMTQTVSRDDLREEARMVRDLSRSLYCLQSLDLTGCQSWFQALCASSSLNEPMVNWNTSWRGVTDVQVGQVWVPELSRRGKVWLKATGGSAVWPAENWALFYEDHPGSSKVVELQKKMATYNRWISMEINSKRAAAMCQQFRVSAGLRVPSFTFTHIEAPESEDGSGYLT